MGLADRSVSDILQNIVRNMQEIVRSEVRLAKSEVREEAGRIKSTALLFGERTQLALLIFYGLATVFIGLSLWISASGWLAWAGLMAFAAHLLWQTSKIKIEDSALCLRLFKLNRDAGLLLFAGLLGDAVLRTN